MWLPGRETVFDTVSRSNTVATRACNEGAPGDFGVGYCNSSQMDQGKRTDELAAERTHLANERTLLAYVRTALALAAAGGVLLQFFPSYPALFGLAWLLVGAGGVTMVIGTYRFFAVRSRLDGSNK
jgi:putative membrane protein